MKLNSAICLEILSKNHDEKGYDKGDDSGGFGLAQ